MKRKMKRFLGILLSLVMVLGLMPGMSLTAYANSITYAPASTYTGLNAFSLKPSDNTVTWSDLSDIKIEDWESVTKDGVTVTLGSYSSFMNGDLNLGSCIFTASQGGISGITIQTEDDLYEPYGGWPSGWIADGSTLTWSGDPAVEVSLEWVSIYDIQQITFTMSDTGTGTKTVWTNETIEIDGEVTVDRRIIVNGNVTLNLKEGSKLIANAGINVSAGNSLTIQGSGELIARIDDQSSQADFDMAAIGGNDGQNAGTITITGGTIEAYGGANAAGIGGGDDGNGGTINISGGTVTAIGGSFGAGIGGGNGKNGGTVNISGGTVIATGGQYGSGGSGSGIGKSGYGSDDGTLTLGDNVLMQVSSDNTTWSEYNGSDRARYMKSYIPTIDILVTGLTLDKTTAQTVTVGDTVSFNATVAPDNASDKTVKWSVGGTNSTAVKLYSDENCTTEVGTDATETLTVYAKGISAGSATVTCTSNADSTKSASCDVTVNAGNTTFDPASTYTGFGDLNTNDTEVTISEVSGKNWYVIANDSSTVTLLSKQSFGSQHFNSDDEKGNAYGTSDIKTYVEGLTGEGQSLAGIKDALADVSVTAPVVTGKVPYLLSQSEAGNLSSTKKTGAGIDWWLRSPGDEGVNAAFVYGESGNVNAIGRIVTGVIGVRPALKLDLSKVTFDSESKTFSVSAAGYNVTITAGNNMTKTSTSGAASQIGLSGAMTDVVYTADDGYYFPTNYSVVSVNGISVTRDSFTQITVSGTPTANAEITLPAPTAKTDQTAPTGLTATKASSGTATDGKIGGVNDDMEYRKDGDTAWNVVGAGKIEITGLTAGTYKVRYAGTADKNASPAVTVEVGIKVAPIVTAPTAKTLTYDGSVQALVNAGITTGGTMNYAVSTNSATAPSTGWSTSIPTGTNAGTYYVWYKVVGDSTHTDTEPVSITVTIKNKPSTPNTPYTPSTPGAPAAEAYTVPVSNENTVDISVNISEGNAVVQEITQADLDKITDDTSGSGSDGDKKTDDTKISVDVSGAKSEVTSVELSSTSIETLAKTVEANEKVDSVEIKMTNATVELDSAAVSAISEQKEGNTIKLVVENKEQAKLNETQKESLKSFTSVKPFQAYFESGGKEIHDFKGGKATVSIKFSPEAGRDAKYYHVYYVPLSGLIERYVTRYLNGWFSYTTSHFSDYAIVYDATMENETGKEDVTPSPSPDVIPTASPAPSASASPSPAPSASTEPSVAPSASPAPSASASPSPAPSASPAPSPSPAPSASAEPGTVPSTEPSQAPSGEKTGPVTAQGQAQAALDINAGLKVIHNGTSASVQWSKVDGAKYYKVYAAYCGSKYKMIKTVDAAAKCKVTIKKLNGKKLSTTKNIKVYVAAYRTVETKNGETVTKKDVRIAKTIAGHVVGKKNKKYSNAKKIKLSKTSYTLKKGKKAKIKAKTVLQYPKRKQLGDAHAKEFRYASSDKSIATVSKSGKITAKKKGSCVIYVYARNGLAKKVKVTVK